MTVRFKTLAGSKLSGCVAAIVLLGTVVPVQSEGPAVSSVNGKISGFGGGASIENDNGGIGGIAGTITLPLGYSFGLQIDGAYARVDDSNFGSTGAHIFWRDPDIGLLGFYGGVARLDKFGGHDLVRLGVEAQKFVGQLTLDGALGYRFGDSFLSDDLYGRGRIQYYLSDDFMLSAGYTYEGRSFGTFGTEYQMSTNENMGLSLFAEGHIRDQGNYTALAGLRVFFGDNLSLKDRHRKQDPDSYTSLDLEATQQAAAAADTGAESCPFDPSPNLVFCSDATLRLRLPPISGVRLASVPQPHCQTRRSQCETAGYGKGNLGPASCGCSEAFHAAVF